MNKSLNLLEYFNYIKTFCHCHTNSLYLGDTRLIVPYIKALAWCFQRGSSIKRVSPASLVRDALRDAHRVTSKSGERGRAEAIARVVLRGG